MQHITTKSHHSEKGRKVYARASGGPYAIHAWDHSLSANENHHAAARRLVVKLGWAREIWVFSAVKKGGFVYVNWAEDQVSL